MRERQPTECQLQTLAEAGEPVGIRDRFRQRTLRFLSAIERRIERWRTRLGGSTPDTMPAPRQTSSQAADPAPPIESTAAKKSIQAGDLVEVLSFEEIQATLDAAGKCDGLQFLEGMKAFCGRRFVVRKQVRLMFDERAWRMLKLRRVYVLDNVICDGRRQYDQEGCDRCCFYFWKDRWLRKTASSAPDHAPPTPPFRAGGR